MSHRIFIVDDHPISRMGLAQLLRLEQDIEVCGEAGSAREALDRIGESKPDLALIDITLPDKSGLELIKDIAAMYPKVLTLVLSMHDEQLYAERVLRAGGRGYIMKEAAPEHLSRAIRRVLAGDIYVSDAMSMRLLKLFTGKGPERTPASPLERLSDREMEVFQLIGHGKASREIAEQLCISIRTIDAHRAHIKEKLGLKDATELVRYAVRWVETGTM
ncbi:MAG: response regulator transcription factor [Verrucomicrobiales bacterium]